MKPGSLLKRISLVVALAVMTTANSGCILTSMTGTVLMWGFLRDAFALGGYFGTSPLIPVSPYYSELIEDAYVREERYDKVPVLDPVEGEHAPLFCQDPPMPDEVMRALPNDTSGGNPFIAETQRSNVKVVVEPIVDRMDDCRFYPMVGPARLHHCHYKCTVYYDKVIRSDWPVPFHHKDETIQVVYIDHDHLIRCAGPATPQ